MKTEQFIKFAAGNGTIFSYRDKHYLFFDKVLTLLPSYSMVTSTSISPMPEWLSEVLNTDEATECQLTDGFLPRADSKGSEIIRVFGNDDVYLTQKQYSFIEKKDRAFYCEGYKKDKDGNTQHFDALLLTDEYGDEAEFKTILIGLNKEDYK